MTMTASTNGKGAAPRQNTPLAADRPSMPGVIRAVLVKELRQNWINLALVICLEFIIVCVAEWFRSGWLFSSNREYTNVLLLPAVRGAITLGCAAAGLLLGILQPLADRNFDLWAFLTHRPVPRWWLYLGRALAGIILYGIAAGLPVAFALAIAPTRWGGHFFLADYMLPPIADWSAGLVYYFAGLLIMERHARWYGSRVVPLFAVIAGSLVVAFVVSFWCAVVIALVLIALYAAAAMGSAVSHGYTLSAPRWTKFLLNLIIFGAFTTIFLFSAGASALRIAGERDAVLRRWNVNDYGQSEFWTTPERYTQRVYVLRPDATLGILTTHFQREFNKNQNLYIYDKHQSWTDLSGHPLPDLPETQEQSADNWSHEFTLGSPQMRSRAEGYRDFSDRVTSFTQDIEHTPYQTAWYWVPEHGLFYLYKTPRYSDHPQVPKLPTTYLGTVGTAGFSPVDAKEQPFPHPTFEGSLATTTPNVLYHLTPHVLYHIDTATREVKPLFTLTAGETILDWNFEPDRVTSGNDRVTKESPLEQRNIWLTTKTRLMRISPTGTLLLTLPLPASSSNAAWIRLYSYPMQRWVVELPQLSADPAIPGTFAFTSSTYCFYDMEGRLLDTQAVPLRFTYTEEPPATLTAKGLSEVHCAEWNLGWLTATANPPAALAAVMTPSLFNPIVGAYGLIPLLQTLGVTGRFFTTLLATMLACGIVGWLLTRAYALPRRRWVWTLLAFVCGPAALLTFLATHRLPRRAKCPHCGHLRLRRDERCRHCNAEWPAPPITGTEIFTSPVPSPPAVY